MHNNKAKLLQEQALPSWIHMWTDVKNCVIRTTINDTQPPNTRELSRPEVEFIFSINRPNQASCFFLSFQAPLILVKLTISFSNSWLVCHFFHLFIPGSKNSETQEIKVGPDTKWTSSDNLLLFGWTEQKPLLEDSRHGPKIKAFVF